MTRNARIAKALGYRAERRTDGENKASHFDCFDPGGTWTSWGTTEEEALESVGIWDEDLNAMYELEGALTPDERTQYAYILASDYGQHGIKDGTWVIQMNWFDLVHLTAAQKAEAWLKVKDQS